MYAAIASGRAKTEKKKADAPVEPQQQVQQSAEPTQQPQQIEEVQPQQKAIIEPKEYIGNNGGSFKVLNQICINTLVSFLPPVSHLAVGVTCHHLNKAFLNLNTWNFQRSVPRSMKAIFKIEVKIPIRKKGEPEDSGFALDEVEADGIDSTGDSVVVTADFFRKESRKQHLQKVWKYQATKIQKARDKAWEEESKKPKDILLTTETTKPAFEMKFPGGIVLSYKESHKPSANPVDDNDSKEVIFVSSKDLTDLSIWLEGAQKLLQGDKRFEVPVSPNSVLSVSRFGRGGTQLVLKVKSTNQKVFFQISDFLLQLRAAVKEFTPVLGRVIMLINQDVKNVTKEENQSYLEYEKFFNGAFKMPKISSSISKIKELLEKGVVPHSNVQFVLQRKREKKRETRAQVEIENSNILDFIYANLPPDFDETRQQSIRQTEEAKLLREQAIQQATIEKEKKRLEKTAQREADRLKREKRYLEKDKDEEEEKTRKTKTKVEKTTDAQGFTVVNTIYTKLDENGKVIEPSEKPNEEKTQKNKEKKGTTKAEKQVSPSLQNNPFAVVTQAGGLESPQEIQAKKNTKKGESRNIENNELQKERKIPAPPPPKVAPKPKSKTAKKKKSKKEAEPEEETVLAEVPSIANVRVVVACAAVAVSLLSYFLLL